MIAILSLLIGAVLGTRFRVLCLIPTAMIGIASIAAFNFIVRTPAGSTMITMLGLIVGLQVGYLFGIAIRSVIIAAHLPVAAPDQLREQSSRIR